MRLTALCVCLLTGCAGSVDNNHNSETTQAALLTLLPTPSSSISDPESKGHRLAFAASQAPHIYMAVQEDGLRENEAHPLSIVFAIDEARDGDLSDDPAIRIAPEDGNCNPQVVNDYHFSAPFDAPVFSGAQVREGVRADQLPAFMAIAASEQIVALGLRPDLDQTRPWNICTRKLWEAQLANPVNTADTSIQTRSATFLPINPQLVRRARTVP